MQNVKYYEVDDIVVGVVDGYFEYCYDGKVEIGQQCVDDIQDWCDK